MTSHTGRLYALATALVLFFLTWAVVAARPWATSTTKATADPRVAALAIRERQLRRESVRVRRIVQRRWALYRVALRKRDAEIAAAHRAQAAATHQAALAAASAAAPPAVRVVTLPALTITRTS